MADIERIVRRQFYCLRQLAAASDAGSAQARLRGIRDDWPCVARRIARYQDATFGSLPSIAAAEDASVGLLSELLAAGADPNERCVSGLHILAECMSHFSPLRPSNLASFRTLLVSGADPNAIGDEASGRPLIQWAVINRKEVYLPDLLAFGGDPTVVCDGADALSIARYHKNNEAIRMIEKWAPHWFPWLDDCAAQ